MPGRGGVRADPRGGRQRGGRGGAARGALELLEGRPWRSTSRSSRPRCGDGATASTRLSRACAGRRSAPTWSCRIERLRRGAAALRGDRPAPRPALLRVGACGRGQRSRHRAGRPLRARAELDAAEAVMEELTAWSRRWAALAGERGPWSCSSESSSSTGSPGPSSCTRGSGRLARSQRAESKHLDDVPAGRCRRLRQRSQQGRLGPGDRIGPARSDPEKGEEVSITGSLGQASRPPGRESPSRVKIKRPRRRSSRPAPPSKAIHPKKK